jgi:NAD(P)-dependent dehydrogenase (short-subunit alcohol dehydrogenase family)
MTDLIDQTMSSPAGTPIEGAVALVTGGHRGFGRAVVDELLERGAVTVYATSRSAQQQRDERIVPLVVDVADDASVAAAPRAAPDVSIVVNNAGVLLRAPVLGAPLADIPANAIPPPGACSARAAARPRRCSSAATTCCSTCASTASGSPRSSTGWSRRWPSPA